MKTAISLADELFESADALAQRLGSHGARAARRPGARPPLLGVVIERGEGWWAELDEPAGAAPGCRRPVLIVQADAFNRSRLQTTVAVVLGSNLRLIDAPGNVLVSKQSAGLPKDSVANVSQLLTLDRERRFVTGGCSTPGFRGT